MELRMTTFKYWGQPGGTNTRLQIAETSKNAPRIRFQGNTMAERRKRKKWQRLSDRLFSGHFFKRQSLARFLLFVERLTRVQSIDNNEA